MNMTLMSSREFNQDVARAKRSADAGPVLITDRGKPAYVLLRHDEWQRLAGPSKSLLEALDMTGGGNIEFDPPRLSGPLFRAPDLG